MKKINQAGMSSILFAMVFVIILSLLAIGFATLVRNDQQQVLDKTLSYQAQYGAETAINRKAAELIADVAANTSISDSNDCSNSLELPAAGGSKATADVTCITWDTSLDSIEKNGLGLDPYITKLNTPSTTSGDVTFSWKPESEPGGNYGAPGTALPTIIDSRKTPILRVTIAKNDLSDLRHLYFVPASDGASLITPSDGAVYYVPKNASGSSYEVSFSYATNGSWVSMMTYGGKANVNIQVRSLGVVQKLTGVQAVIDANARALDVTKRVQARVSLLPQTWNPGFALLAGKTCKDFRVDGTQGKSASGATDPCY